MKNKDYYILALIFIVTCLMCMFVSCAKRGQQVPANNTVSNIQVELLFEVNGVNVYRFYDCGHFVYFTNRAGQCEYEIDGKNRKRVVTLCEEVDNAD